MIVIPIELQILIFSVSGVTLKLADHWGELEHKLPAYTTAILSAGFFGWLAAQNPLNGALIFGILLGVIVAQKVDRGNLGVGVIATVLFAILFNAPLPSLWLIVSVACAAALDEIGHDRTNTNKWYIAVFRFRPILKLVVISLGLLTWIPYHIILNVLGFDLSYELTNGALAQKNSGNIEEGAL
jgi:hypothetical protein